MSTHEVTSKHPTSSLGMNLRGSSAAPLATSEGGLEVANAEAGAVVQPAAQGGCMVRMGKDPSITQVRDLC